jgi:hypothetical protein
MSKKRGKKLALKRETLRKLDNNELSQAAGGYVAKTTLCGGATGGCAYTVSGGCTTEIGQLDAGILVIKGG